MGMEDIHGLYFRQHNFLIPCFEEFDKYIGGTKDIYVCTYSRTMPSLCLSTQALRQENNETRGNAITQPQSHPI